MTAFLLLSIVPLSLISFVASTQARASLQDELREKLSTIAALTALQIQSWAENQQAALDSLSVSLTTELQSKATARIPPNARSTSTNASSQPPQSSDYPAWTAQEILSLDAKIAQFRHSNPAFSTLILQDAAGDILLSIPQLQEENDVAAKTAQNTLVLEQTMDQTGLTLVAVLNPEHLVKAVGTSVPWKENGEIYLLTSTGYMINLNRQDNSDKVGAVTGPVLAPNAQLYTVLAMAKANISGVTSYENPHNVQVVGAYHWLPELNMTLLVEQPQAVALAASDDLAVVLIGATLAAALLTALIAAAVTRRITLPIIELTATAVQIASGDLDRKVPTTRRDEIGILARAFNVMTTKLRALYEGLEQKVQERTQQLREANAEIRYRATQLAISAEVGRVATSILDRDLLLPQVAELIRDCFQAYFVAIYLFEDNGEWAVLQEGTGGLGKRLKSEHHRVHLHQNCLVSQVARTLEPQVYLSTDPGHLADRELFPHTQAELAVPLKIGQRRIGVLDVHSTLGDAFQEDEVMVIETLAGQIAVAIENARAYELEREAAEQLREMERFRRRFLSNMSRELRMPLNNIIGFSRVILKGIDGPITDLQREDLTAIHESGQQLLALINDLLDIAHIEAGEMELAMRPVDLAEIAHSVIPTANALLEGRPIQLVHDIPASTPPVLADPSRLRQVLVKLVSNAAKFTQEGEISIRVWSDNSQVFASIGDTGIGIPEQYRDRVFELFNQVSNPKSGTNGTGLGLTFSKEIVEMHGGTISMESQEGQGTIFTVALPIHHTLEEGM